MKTVAVLLLCAIAAHAQPAPAWRVRTELLVVRVPQAVGLRLRPQLREAATTEAAVTELQAMIARNDATLVGAPVVWSANGQRVLSETVEEILYPIKSDPPEPPHHIVVPHTFVTQNAGVTLEFEATPTPDGQTIAFNIVPQHVSFEGYASLFQGQNPIADWHYSQPRFRVQRTVTSLTARSGAWQLVNVSVIREPVRQMEFFLLRATAFSIAP